ncbi:FAD-dependent monooxygenase [Pelagibaculum spongiae]|uniref:FAD-binding domain-containing protein n=1 Tax=Pelagibaculum spongiae TaxID=2080658 RepID=A0A2V1H0V3_9GAMM|nr:FAD-dependent monooxygenase [Pelagibaculum spongiae]PVZ72289.1 hypothetical protein DC094_04565 [Pelagibaculum spongiae]
MENTESAAVKKMQQFDIGIVGGGIVGLALVASLVALNQQQNKKLNIALYEQFPAKFKQPESEDDWDLRVSAITPASSQLFKSIGVWDQIAEHRIAPYQGMQVWDSLGDGKIEFSAEDLKLPFLGHIIENRVMRKVLWQWLELQAADPDSGVELFCPVTLNSAQYSAAQQLTSLELQKNNGNHEQHQLKLAVAADGANSWLRRQLGLRHSERAYGHQALVTTIRTEQPHQQICRQAFMSSGPLALLPLADPHTCSIVWSADDQKATELQNYSPTQLAGAIAAAMDHRLGEVALITDNGFFPLRMRHATHYGEAGIALVGDACHTVHPLAGLGMNLGLMDAAMLAQVICENDQSLENPGDALLMRRYQRRRKAEITSVLLAMDSFRLLFGSKFIPLVQLRNFGLKMTDRLGPIKNLFAGYAVGNKADTPVLARVK